MNLNSLEINRDHFPNMSSPNFRLSGGSLGYWTACNNFKRYCTLPYCEQCLWKMLLPMGQSVQAIWQFKVFLLGKLIQGILLSTHSLPRANIKYWLPAWWASGFFGDHQQNHRCLWFHSCYVLRCLYSVENKITTTTNYACRIVKPSCSSQ